MNKAFKYRLYPTTEQRELFISKRSIGGTLVDLPIFLDN